MLSGELGKIYHHAEIIIRQGQYGSSMYVVQEGQVEIVQETASGEVLIALRGKGEFFGEAAVFERAPHPATARALGDARVLTIDKKNFLRRVYEDPSLAFHFMQSMSAQIRELSAEVSLLHLILDEQQECASPTRPERIPFPTAIPQPASAW